MTMSILLHEIKFEGLFNLEVIGKLSILRLKKVVKVVKKFSRAQQKGFQRSKMFSKILYSTYDTVYKPSGGSGK